MRSIHGRDLAVTTVVLYHDMFFFCALIGECWKTRRPYLAEAVGFAQRRSCSVRWYVLVVCGYSHSIQTTLGN